MDSDLVIYVIVFLVVLIPSLMSGIGDTKEEEKSSDALQSNPALAQLPLYRLLGGVIKAVEGMGIGAMIASMRPAKTSYLEGRLTIANLPMKPQTVYAAQVLVAPLCGLLAFGMFWVLPLDKQWAWFALVMGLWMGWVYPAVAVEGAADKRQTEIVRGLPFAIDLIGSAMRSGLDFGAAVRYYVSLGIETPLTVEFGIMLRQIELGKTRIEALKAMAVRIDNKEFTSFVGSVVHGTQVGASIVDTMEIQGEEMRRARFHLAERKAARAPSLMILPMALFIMPAVFIIIFTPVYLKVQATGMGGMFRH